jgi:acid phosphatase
VGLLALALAACTAAPEGENLSRVKQQLRHYVTSGEYDREIAAVAEEAEQYLSARAARTEPESSGKLAIVLDIDDTALSTWPSLMANDFGLIKHGGCAIPEGPCGWSAWQERAVFFITGRHEKYREATVRNLRTAGYRRWTGLVLKSTHGHDPSAADYKGPARQKLEQDGYAIVLNMGDQESDLAGGHAERTFKLPNPFYLIP